jgi:hypothetical protein
MPSRAGVEGTFIPAGLLQSAGVIARSYPAGQSGWFSPGPAQVRAVPMDVEPRIWAYPPLYNLGLQPRGQEPVSFEQLRSLANLEDITRMAIETRKDQVEKVPFTAKLKRMKGETKAQLKARTQNDDRLDEVNAFMENPGRVLYYPEIAGEVGQPQLKTTPWNGWLRSLLEDLLVIDAPAVMVRRAIDNTTPFSLDVMDGALWRPILDKNGHTTCYQQWLYGVPGETLGPQELIYMPRNPRSSRGYGFSPVEQLVFTINTLLRREAKQLASYTDGNIPDALASVPETWGVDQIEKFQKGFDARLSGNPRARSKLTFMPGGPKPVQVLGQEVLKTEEDEWWARKVAYAFSLSPQWAIKQQSRAQSESAVEEALEQGLVPMLDYLGTFFTLLQLIAFGYQDIEIVSELRRDVDPAVQATIDKTHFSIGAKSINEIRDANGQDGIAGGEKYFVETASSMYEVTAEGLVPVAPATSHDPASDGGDPGQGKPGQKQIGDGKQLPAKEPPAKKRALRYALDSPHVLADRIARLEKAARVSA